MLLLAFALTIIAVFFAVPVVALLLLGRYLFRDGSTRDYEIGSDPERSRGITGAVVWRVWQKWMKEKPRQLASRDRS